MNQNKILDLTSNNWKAEKQWNKVGLEQSKSHLTKSEKIANTAAVVNMVIPMTAWPITSPIIIKIGRMRAIREKVKLQ